MKNADYFKKIVLEQREDFKNDLEAFGQKYSKIVETKISDYFKKYPARTTATKFAVPIVELTEESIKTGEIYKLYEEESYEEHGFTEYDNATGIGELDGEDAIPFVRFLESLGFDVKLNENVNPNAIFPFFTV